MTEFVFQWMFFEQKFVVDGPAALGFRPEGLCLFDWSLSCRLPEIHNVYVGLDSDVVGCVGCQQQLTSSHYHANYYSWSVQQDLDSQLDMLEVVPAGISWKRSKTQLVRFHGFRLSCRLSKTEEEAKILVGLELLKIWDFNCTSSSGDI